MTSISRAALLLHVRLRDRKAADTAAIADRLKLAPGAAAVVRCVLEHGQITTEKADELLERAEPLVYRRTPRRSLSRAKAREVCMGLVDDGLLAFGDEADTWRPSLNLRRDPTR